MLRKFKKEKIRTSLKDKEFEELINLHIYNLDYSIPVNELLKKNSPDLDSIDPDSFKWNWVMKYPYGFSWFISREKQYQIVKEWQEKRRKEIINEIKRRYNYQLEIINREKQEKENYVRNNPHLMFLKNIPEEGSTEIALKYLDIFAEKKIAIKKLYSYIDNSADKIFFELEISANLFSDQRHPDALLYSALLAYGKPFISLKKEYLKNNPEITPIIENFMKNKSVLFPDILFITDTSIQRMLREIDTSELAKALHHSSSQHREKIFSNMSARAAQLLKEDMDIMGPVNYERSVNSIQKIGTILSNLYSKNEIKYIDKALWTQYVDTKDPDLQYLKRFPEKIRKETSFTLLRIYFEYLNELNNINEQADKKKTELFNSITNSFSSELIKKTNEAVLAKYAFKGTNRELRNIYFKQSDIPLKELNMIFHKYLTDFNILEQMDDRLIQYLLRKMDFSVLAKALSFAHYNIQDKILFNLSKKEGENLKMRINSNRNIPLEEAFIAQSEIADYIMLLGKDYCTGIHYP